MKKVLCYGVIMAVFLLSAGCSVDSITAPDGSVITVSPSELALTGLSGDTAFNFNVVVKDGSTDAARPLNKVKLYISGPFGSPRSPARFQFYTGLDGGGTQVDSGFECTTNGFGVCSFSIIVPATVGGQANAFEDYFLIDSGTASETVSIALETAT